MFGAIRADEFSSEYHSRYELPLVRLVSFYELSKPLSPAPFRLLLVALADGVYYARLSCAHLVCCLCDGSTDLQPLLTRLSLAQATLASEPTPERPRTFAAQLATLLEDIHGSLHRNGCPKASSDGANNANIGRKFRFLIV